MGSFVDGFDLEDLNVGQVAELVRTVGAADLRIFAASTGDNNPLHLDGAYADETPFKGRIARGMLCASYISAVIGTKLPGPDTTYVSQFLRFRRPVRVGDSVTRRVEIVRIENQRGHVRLATVCMASGKPVVEGQAAIMVPRRGA